MTEIVSQQTSVFAQAGAVVTSTHLTIEDPRLAYEHFEELAVFIGTLKNASSFWLGDLLNAGEDIFGEEYAQVEAALEKKLSKQTIMNVQSICRKVPKSRRRKGVSFSHHAEVAPLQPNDQRRLLKVADEEGLSKEALRDRIRAERNGTPDIFPPPEPEVCPVCHRPL